MRRLGNIDLLNKSAIHVVVKELDIILYDICIIGAGIVGMNIARELSKYKINICVIEEKSDVGCGCSKANSGIVHGGYSDEPGTLKAKMCVKGNAMYDSLNQQLNFGYRKTGSLVVAFTESEIDILQSLYNKGIKNGVPGLKLMSGDEARAVEPYLSQTVRGALYCETAGVTSPYEFVIALAENAIANGVDIKLDSKVIGIEKVNNKFKIITDKKEAITGNYIVNAAGIYSDSIAKMVGIDKYKITPRRGQYIIFDKKENHLAKSVIFQVPSIKGKGVLVATTFHGNLLIGPSAEEIANKEDVGTDESTLIEITKAAQKSIPQISLKKALKSFAGNRPISNQKDWVIEESNIIPKFINLIGIDSPGLTSSPAIALEVIKLLTNSGLSLKQKADFQVYRTSIIKKKNNSFNGDINSQDPEKHIICRCEQVTEAEIIDCLHRGLPVKTLDAVARRTRAGFGTCQGAFCGARVRQLLARELNVSPEEIPKRENKFSDLVQRVKQLDIKNL